MKKFNINFKLKEPSASNPTLIYLKSYFNYQRLTYSTGRKIHPQYWHDGMQRPITYRRDFLKKEIKEHPNPTDLQNELKLIESLIKQGKIENPMFNTEMQNITTDLNDFEKTLISAYEYLNRQKEPITKQRLKEWMDESFKEEKSNHKPVNEFYKRFEGFLDIRKTVYSHLTIKKYNTLKKKLQAFEKKKRYKITFDTIDLVFYDKFKDYMLSEKNYRTAEASGLLNDTVSKYISALKTFMQWSLERGYHNNTIFQSQQFSARKKAKNDIVTLTETELEKIYTLDLSKEPELEKIRDLFCFACYTGQRWSDIDGFRKEDVKGDTWIFYSHKAKKTIRVPFKGFLSPALDILKKYDFDLPKTYVQRFDTLLKIIGEKAGIVETITLNRESGKDRVRTSKPKYKYMASHMARRTCITILLQKGVPPTTVMLLTGHKDIKTLMKYENTSDEALVEALDNT